MEFTEHLCTAMERLHKNHAFLTVKSGETVNTMTISWGSIGFMWGKPVFMTMVRNTRYTYELLQNATDFTISIPTDDRYRAELAVCGSKSGRDTDKLTECGISLLPAKEIETPVIAGGGFTYECRIACAADMGAEVLPEALREAWYKSGDYHTFFYGFIEAAYIEDGAR